MGGDGTVRGSVKGVVNLRAARSGFLIFIMVFRIDYRGPVVEMYEEAGRGRRRWDEEDINRKLHWKLLCEYIMVSECTSVTACGLLFSCIKRHPVGDCRQAVDSAVRGLAVLELALCGRLRHISSCSYGYRSIPPYLIVASRIFPIRRH